MKKILKLILSYFIYFLTSIVVIFLLLPSSVKQSVEMYWNSMAKNSKETINYKSDDKYIILTFDDGWDSQYNAFNMLKPFRGTLYICSSLINKENRLTLDNLDEMYNNGWDISNHTVHHNNLTNVSLDKAYDEIYGCSAWIYGHGFKRDMGYKHFAYPEGGYNDDIIEILKKQKYLTARTVNPGDDTSNLLELGRTSLHGMTKENIRNYILSDKKLIILCFHRIIPDSQAIVSDIDLKESYLKEVISSIYESKRKVITITEWYKLEHIKGAVALTIE